MKVFRILCFLKDYINMKLLSISIIFLLSFIVLVIIWVYSQTLFWLFIFPMAYLVAWSQDKIEKLGEINMSERYKDKPIEIRILENELMQLKYDLNKLEEKIAYDKEWQQKQKKKILKGIKATELKLKN